MKTTRLALVVGMTLLVFGALAAHSGASRDRRTGVACSTDPRNPFLAYPKQRPENCALARGDRIDVYLHHLRWKTWGYGRAKANGFAYKKPAHVIAYRKRRGPYCGSNVDRGHVYTRVKVKTASYTTTYGTAAHSC